MKPLLVLVAVGLAAAGLFFVLQDDGKPAGDNQTTVVVSNDPEPAGEAPAEEPSTDLEKIETSSERVQGATTQKPTEVLPVTDDLQAAAGLGQLTGSVVDANGSPIAQAEVTLTRYGSQSFFIEDIDRSTDETAVTGSDGTFAFDRVPAFDGYALIASHPDFSRTENSTVIVQDGGVTEAPPIVLVPGRSIKGVVSDTGGNAVPNAILVLNESMLLANLGGAGQGADTTSVTSDKLGRYEFKNVSPGQNYVIEVNADGYGGINTAPLAVLETEDTVHDVTLEVASMLAGMITSSSGDVIEGVTIQAYLIDKGKPNTNSTTKTDDTGYFEVTDIPPGDFQIVARHPMYKADARTRAKSGDMNITIELQPLPVVSGRVVDASTGAPVTNFEVQLRNKVSGAQNNLSTADPSTRRRVESPDGKFEIVVPRAGEFMVEGIAEGWANTSSDPFTTTMGSDTPEITVRMTKGGTLTGRVLGAGGAPIEGATVATHDKEWSDDLFWQSLGAGAPGSATEVTVRTGADGSFTIPRLTPAEYQLVVRHRDHAQEIVKGLSVAEGQTARVPDVKLPLGGEISGTVIGAGGTPLAGATVKMFPTTQNARTYNAQTNKNGEYRIKNIRQGTYKVHATRPKTATDNPFQENIDLKATQRTLTLQNGSTMAGQDFKLTD